MSICPICHAMYWNGPFPHKCAPVWVAVTKEDMSTDNDIDLALIDTLTVRAHDAEDAAAQAAMRFDDNDSEGPSESRIVGVVAQTELEALKFQRRAMEDSLMPAFNFEWFDVAGEVKITYIAHRVPSSVPA